MKKTLIAAIALGVLYGCGSDPVKDEGKAGGEYRTPSARGAAPTGPSTQPVQPAQVPMSPLKDPKNILSKRSVFFDYDSDVIKEEFRPLLQAHGKYLAEHSSAKMLVQGNADERGSREYNIALGQRRAEGIRRMLALMGAREAQIESVSLGEEKPRCTDTTETCYAQNRRGDMLYNGEY